MFHLANYHGNKNFRFITLTGVHSATLAGEVISGQFKNGLSEFPAEKGATLLVSFVNSHDDPKSILQFVRKYGPLWSPPVPNGSFSFELKKFREAQAHFREIWPAPEKLGDWEEKAGRLRFCGGTITYSASNIFSYLQCVFSANIGRIRVCKSEECSHPYLIAAHLKKQFCSANCAEAAQRSAKRDWWQKSGQIVRAERREEAKKQVGRKVDSGVPANHLKSSNQKVSQRQGKTPISVAKAGQT